MIIGIDVDGVVAELHTAWFARYNKDYNDSLTIDKILSWGTHEYVKPECGMKIYDYLKDPTLYDDVTPIEDSLNVINKLKEDGHRIIYITTTPIETPGVKFNWLVKHGFINSDDKKNYFEATDKSLICCDVLFDDKYENALLARYMGVLLNYPHNFGFSYSPRVNNWLEFYNFIEEYK